MSIKQKPIGIFDSGLGGLTIAKAISIALPNEQIIYFGDTAHLPYDNKSKETIVGYSENIARFLVKQECKVILIACNSASANAYDEVVNAVGEKIKVINVIDPMVEHIAGSDYKNIGIIGTKSTIESNSYNKKIKNDNKGMIISSLATPLLIPMIDEGIIFDEISNVIIRHYLSHYELRDIEALILGCNQYQVIKNQINKFYNFEVDILDSTKLVLDKLRKIISEEGLINDLPEKKSNKFYVSELTDHYKLVGKMFYDEEILLEKINL